MMHFLQAILMLLIPLLLDHQAEVFPITKVLHTTTSNNEFGSGQATVPNLVHYQGKSRKLLVAVTLATTDTLPTASHHKVDIRLDELPASHPMVTNDATTSLTGISLVKASKASTTSKGNAKENIADIIDITDYSSAKRKPPIHN